MDFIFEDVFLDMRKKDLNEVIEYRNHKGAIKNDKLLDSNMNTEVEHALDLTIPLKKVSEIEGSMMAPTNIAYKK